MIQVLYTDISNTDSVRYQQLYHSATEDRKLRADRCLDRESALRCLVAGALLRYAVGSDGFSVETDVMGKPRLQGRKDFHFNLSHSGPWVVIAFGESPVGVDVETRAWNESAEKIANRFFAPEERAYVLQSKQNCRERFLQVWTSKESYLKYLGTGIRCPLHSFNILSEELQAHLTARCMPDGAWITLYAQNRDIIFEYVELPNLIKPV